MHQFTVTLSSNSFCCILSVSETDLLQSCYNYDDDDGDGDGDGDDDDENDDDEDDEDDDDGDDDDELRVEHCAGCSLARYCGQLCQHKVETKAYFQFSTNPTLYLGSHLFQKRLCWGKIHK